MSPTEVVLARRAHRGLLWRLLQLYLHDFSELDGRSVNERGEYEYRYFDAYWTDPMRTALLLRIGAEWAGFALIRRGIRNEVAEFFVIRKFRRRGAGRRLAHECFKRFPGPWAVRQLKGNEAATAFWRAVIPVPFTSVEGRAGVTQRFVIGGESEDGEARTRPSSRADASQRQGARRTRAERRRVPRRAAREDR